MRLKFSNSLHHVPEVLACQVACCECNSLLAALVTKAWNGCVHAAAVRSIGSDYSPSFGYRGSPDLDLTAAVPNSGPAPLPVPAGLLDVTLSYLANSSANSQCGNASNTLISAFLIQVHFHVNLGVACKFMWVDLGIPCSVFDIQSFKNEE